VPWFPVCFPISCFWLFWVCTEVKVIPPASQHSVLFCLFFGQRFFKYEVFVLGEPSPCDSGSELGWELGACLFANAWWGVPVAPSPGECFGFLWNLAFPSAFGGARFFSWVKKSPGPTNPPRFSYLLGSPVCTSTGLRGPLGGGFCFFE